MFKRIILILALICMVVLPVFSQTGTYTSNDLFYLPKYGASGMDEYNEYNLYMEKADNQIQTNKSGIAAIDLSLYYLKTEIDTQFAILKFTDLTDTPANYTDQAGKYVKVNAGETALEFGTPAWAGTFLELTDTPAAYDNGKYAKSTSDGVVWDTPAGYTNLTSFVDQTAWRLFYSNTDGDVTELALGTDGQVLTSGGVDAAPTFEDAGGAGETNTASNIGWTSDDTEAKLFKQKDGVDLEFRSLKEGTAIDFTWISGSGIRISQTVYSGGQAIMTGAKRGQSWLSGSTYLLDRIECLMFRSGTGHIATIYVYASDGDGYPTGDLLGSKAVDVTAITTDSAGEWVNFDLSASSISIVNTNRYIWYLEGIGTTNISNVNYNNGDVLADSWFVYYWSDTWTKATTWDAAFKIYSIASYYDYVQVGIADGNIILLSTTTVSFAADADTTLYTVPAGKRCVLTKAIVVAADDAGATTTIAIGANGSETDFIPANTLSNLDAQYDSVILKPIPNTTPLKIKSYAAATVIEAQVASQSGVAGNMIYLFGITY